MEEVLREEGLRVDDFIDGANRLRIEIGRIARFDQHTGDSLLAQRHADPGPRNGEGLELCRHRVRQRVWSTLGDGDLGIHRIMVPRR